MHASTNREKIEIDITDDDHEWIERIGKTAYKICKELDHNRIKLNDQHTGFIIETNDAAALGCIGWVGLSSNILIPFQLT